MLQHVGADEYHGGVCHESRTGVHEDTYEDGHHGVGQYVDVYERVAHKQGRQQGKDDDEGVEHGGVARVLEVVLAIE